MARRIGRFLVGVAVLYCLGVAVLAFLWLARVTHPWWVALTNIFALYFFIPLLLLLPLAVVVSSRWLRVAVVGVTILFVILFGPRFVPRLGGTPPDRPLRVMTFNLQRTGKTQDLVSLVQLIRVQNPDVVALQEVSEAAKRTLDSDLIPTYPHQVVTAASAQTSLLLLSRYPLERTFPSPQRSQRVVIALDNGPVTFLNVSLPTPRVHTAPLPGLPGIRYISGYTTRQRADAITALLAVVDTTPGPLVMLGDFNLSDREAAYPRFSRRLLDAYRQTTAGFGFTFPHNKQLAGVGIPFPLIRIDYIWSNETLRPTAAQVICQRAVSDHCAVLADLALEAPEEK